MAVAFFITAEVGGAVVSAVRTVDANTNIGLLDDTIECITNSFTVTLPSAVGLRGRIFRIVNQGPGTITLAAQAGELIADANTQSLIQYEAYTVQSNGTGWMVL